jgi:hypothetical protein
VFDAQTALRELADAETRSIYADMPDTDAGSPAAADASAPAGTDAAAKSDSDSAPAAAAASADAADASADANTDSETPVDTDESPATDNFHWLPDLQEAATDRRWPHLAAAALLAGILGIQITHEFRRELGALPVVGPVIQLIYAGLGQDASARVELGQYELLDLSAVAEPVTEDQGWLVIETRVRNKGPRVQPAPYIFVSLLDRWQETVAGRYFAPGEYAVNTIADASRMNVGSTIDAQFIIVDPGPGATGFELQICTPMEQSFSCDGDATFN